MHEQLLRSRAAFYFWIKVLFQTSQQEFSDFQIVWRIGSLGLLFRMLHQHCYLITLMLILQSLPLGFWEIQLKIKEPSSLLEVSWFTLMGLILRTTKLKGAEVWVWCVRELSRCVKLVLRTLDLHSIERLFKEVQFIIRISDLSFKIWRLKTTQHLKESILEAMRWNFQWIKQRKSMRWFLKT